MRGRTIVLIAVTGYGQPADRARAEDAGFDRHMVKPVDLTHLSELLDGLPRVDAPPPSDEPPFVPNAASTRAS
jgi:CheY-like chemotaxis protein